MRMRIQRNDCAVGFNVWAVQGTWFWSLVYPDRHGGAIGAAASKAEALEEAQTAIERLLQLRDDLRITRETCSDPNLIRELQSLKDSPVGIHCKLDGTTGDFAFSSAARKRSSKMHTVGESYNNLWQLTLQQYAARVAAT